MHSEQEDTGKQLVFFESVRWVIAFVLIMFVIFGNYLYRDDYGVFTRGLVIFLVVAMAMYLVSGTRVGQLVIIFGKEARIELRRVIWPTYREGLYNTLLVIAVTVITSLILWGLDTILVYTISFGLRL